MSVRIERGWSVLWWLWVAGMSLLWSGPLRAEEPLPPELDGVTVQERLGDRVDPGLEFTDHTGKRARLGDYLTGQVPVILTLNYYRCTMLCNLQLNALTEGLRGLGWRPGERFRVVTVSIDPRERLELAAGKRRSYLETLGMGEVDWTFLTGTQENIEKLAASVGFGYRYDAASNEYAHPATAMFLSPDGRVTRYLYGLEYAPRDLKFALMEASDGRVGSVADRVILSCFHYDPTTRQYAPFAYGIMRAGGAFTVLALGGLLAALWARERGRSRRLAAAGAGETAT